MSQMQILYIYDPKDRLKNCRGAKLRQANLLFGGGSKSSHLQGFPSFPSSSSLSITLLLFFLLLSINLTHLISMTISSFSNYPLCISLSSPVQTQHWASLISHLVGCRTRMRAQLSWSTLWRSLVTQHCLLWLHIYLEKMSFGMHEAP